MSHQHRSVSLVDRESRLAFRMLLPTFLVVMAVIIFPVLWNIWLSFKPVTLGSLRDASLLNLQFTLKNYAKVILDPDFGSGLSHTLIYAITGSALSVLFGFDQASLLIVVPQGWLL